MRLVSFFLLSFVTSAESDNDAAAEMTAMDLNYRVDAYECDDELRGLSKDDQHKKKLGMAYRICFEPNSFAKVAGVGIKKLDFWGWETSHDGVRAVQTAVIDGKGIGGISHIECLDGGKKCFFDTMLTTEFYQNSGTVIGKGEASFTAGTGSVPVAYNLFKISFSVTLRDGLGGKEYTDEETAEIMKKVDLHNADLKAEESNEKPIAEDFQSTEEVKEEL